MFLLANRTTAVFISFCQCHSAAASSRPFKPSFFPKNTAAAGTLNLLLPYYSVLLSYPMPSVSPHQRVYAHRDCCVRSSLALTINGRTYNQLSLSCLLLILMDIINNSSTRAADPSQHPTPQNNPENHIWKAYCTREHALNFPQVPPVLAVRLTSTWRTRR